MIDSIEHMKWSGWGREGVAFTVDDKPGFAPFARAAIGLDITDKPPNLPSFGDLDVPSSRLTADLDAVLAATVGAAYIAVDDECRVLHSYGKGFRDLLRIRANRLARVVDVVVYPADEAQVQAVVDAAVAFDAVVIPFGGGTNIVGSLEPPADESRVIVSLDLGRMNLVLEIDEESRLARLQAGALGPFIERQLGRQGWTLGHFPDSFTHSTLGGWVATRSSGMQSDKYGDIADIVRGLRLVRSGEPVVLQALPSTSTGPSVREMIIGSEGRLGVITEATVQVHRIPENRTILGYLFPSWDDGLAAMREIAESPAAPTVTRVSDANETRFIFATRRRSGPVESAVTQVLLGRLRRRGWDLDRMCLSFVGFEGSSRVDRERKLVRRIVHRHGGVVLGRRPGDLYDRKKFDTPYLRDFLLDRGAAADVSETAAPWSKLPQVYARVQAAAGAAFERIGAHGWLMCHFAHSYHCGACLYFTFAFRHGADPLAQYDVVKQAVQDAFIEAGGTLSHHHGVGVEHRPWLDRDISRGGADLLHGLFAAGDPTGMWNPGKIVATAPRTRPVTVP